MKGCTAAHEAFLLVIVFLGRILASAGLSSPQTTAELFTHIVSAGGLPTNNGVLVQGDIGSPGRTVGFLSAANWHPVKHALPLNTVAYFGTSTDDLINKVKSGDLVAALIKGMPLDPGNNLNTWQSATVTTQAMFFTPNSNSNDLHNAMDAALVRMLAKGKAQQAKLDHPPNNHLEVHTCKAQQNDFDKFPFPPAMNATGLLADVLTSGTLKMMAYAAYAGPNHGNCQPDCTCDNLDSAGSLNTCLANNNCSNSARCTCIQNYSNCSHGDNWAQDGDYTTSPATGFWPDYTEALMDELREAYSPTLSLQRVWCSSTCLTGLLAGVGHVTEPYFIVDSFLYQRARVRELSMSCTTMGGSNTFFTRKIDMNNQGSDNADINTTLLALVVIGSTVLALSLGFIAVLVHREKRGEPLFVGLVRPQKDMDPGI